MPKFLLMVNHDNGVADDRSMDEWEPEEVQAHMNYYEVRVQPARYRARRDPEVAASFP
jgi:hypothetical protein